MDSGTRSASLCNDLRSPIHDDECPHSHQALKFYTEILLLRWKSSPRNRHGLVHSSDSIKEMFVSNNSNFEKSEFNNKNANKCEKCGEITSQKI